MSRMTIAVCLSMVFFTVHAFGEMLEKSGDWEQITTDEFLIANNVWGKGSIPDYKQTIFYGDTIQPGHKLPDFGWRWVWPRTGGNVKAYPAVVFGRKPWNPSSTTVRLPRPVNDCSFVVEYEYKTDANGVYNCAFDIFLTEPGQYAPRDIRAELMIWTANIGMTSPPGSTEKTVIIDNKEYNLAIARNFGDGDVKATYIAFIAKSNSYKGTLKLKSFIKYLVKENVISSRLSMASIEFGNEIIQGEGETTISKYEIK